jgi:hypothetical protein
MKRAVTRHAVIVAASYRAAVVQVFCMALLGLTCRSAVGVQIHSNRLPAAFGVKKEIPYEKQN